MATDPASMFNDALLDLKAPTKSSIAALTMLAAENKAAASSVAAVIENHLITCPPEYRLPALYLLDSIAKNARDPYVMLFARNLPQMFLSVREVATPKTQAALERLFGTWRGIFPDAPLDAIVAAISGGGSGGPYVHQQQPVPVPVLANAQQQPAYAPLAQAAYPPAPAGGVYGAPGAGYAPPYGAPYDQASALPPQQQQQYGGYAQYPLLQQQQQQQQPMYAAPQQQQQQQQPMYAGAPAPPAAVAELGYGYAQQPQAYGAPAAAADAGGLPPPPQQQPVGDPLQQVGDVSKLLSLLQSVQTAVPALKAATPPPPSPGLAPAPSPPPQQQQQQQRHLPGVFDAARIKDFDRAAADLLATRSDANRSRHLDRLFLHRQRLKQTAQEAASLSSQRWYVDVDNWIVGTTADGVGEAGAGAAQQGDGDAAATGPGQQPGQGQQQAEASVPVDESQPCCALSGERFDQFWDRAHQEWRYRGAVRLGEDEAARYGVPAGSFVLASCLGGSSGPGVPGGSGGGAGPDGTATAQEGPADVLEAPGPLAALEQTLQGQEVEADLAAAAAAEGGEGEAAAADGVKGEAPEIPTATTAAAAGGEDGKEGGAVLVEAAAAEGDATAAAAGAAAEQQQQQQAGVKRGAEGEAGADEDGSGEPGSASKRAKLASDEE